jgi:nitrous oxidase accessory protein
MRTSAATIIFIIAIFLLAGMQVTQVVEASSRTLVVPDDFDSIQDAVNNALEGDTVYVKKGVYVENPAVNKSISLVGEDRDATVIDVTAGLKVESNNVSIIGFTIYDGWRGISLTGNYCTVSGNRITNATNGIVLFGNENRIVGNIFESIAISSAIQLNHANKNLVTNNSIDSCVEGIQIWQNSNNNTISENTVKNIQEYAISFQYSNDNALMRNNITRSGIGTSIYGSNRNVITYNNYVDNAVQFSANEDYYLTFGYNRSVNTINQNYWNDYHRADANGDGTGDTPYVINEYNQDSQPLMEAISLNQAQNTPSPQSTPDPSSNPTPNTSQSPSPSNSLTPSPSHEPTTEQSPIPSVHAPPPNYTTQYLLVGVVISATILTVILAFVSKRRRD